MTFFKKQKASVVAIAIGLTVVALLLVQFNLRLLRYEEAEMQTYLEEIRDKSIFTLRSEIEQFATTIRNEARTLGLLGAITDEEILAELRDFPTEESLLRLHIQTPGGRFYSSLENSVIDYDPARQSDIVNDRKEHISTPRFSTSFGEKVVQISVPLYIDGRHFGILAGCYDLEYFEELLINNFLEGDCIIDVAASDGTMISHSAYSASLSALQGDIFDFYRLDAVEFIDGSAQELIDNLQTAQPGYASYQYMGTRRYLSYAPTGIRDWHLAAVATNRTLEQRTAVISSYAMWLVWGVGAVVMLIAIVIFWTSAREHAAVQEVLQKAASIDALTQLYNRSTIEHFIEQFLATHGAAGNHALLMLDIDGFKHVNDRLGHIKGDEVLAQFGILLRKVLPEQALVGRIGGDEFIALLPSYGSTQELVEVAQSICQEFNQIHFFPTGGPQTAHTSASIGIALYPQDGNDFPELYHSADVALYAAKNAGKDGYAFFE